MIQAPCFPSQTALSNTTPPYLSVLMFQCRVDTWGHHAHTDLNQHYDSLFQYLLRKSYVMLCYLMLLMPVWFTLIVALFSAQTKHNTKKSARCWFKRDPQQAEIPVIPYHISKVHALEMLNFMLELKQEMCFLFFQWKKNTALNLMMVKTVNKRKK